MAPRPLNPVLRLALELGPVVLFFAGYLALRDSSVTVGGRTYAGFIVVTAAFIPVVLAATALLWRLSGHLSRMQVATAVLVVVFGGLSVALNDDRFFKMKPTIIYALFAGVLGVGLLRGRSWLQYLMGGLMPLRPEGWMILTRRLAIFFALLAVANEVIWRTLSTDAWVSFKTFGLTAALFLFFMAQAGLMRRYAADGGER